MEQKDYLSYSVYVDTDMKEGFNVNNNNFPDLSGIIHRSNNISNNISDFSVNIDEEIKNDILDKNGVFVHNSSVIDVARHDAQTMLIQQNSVYIVGTITIATLIITTILLSK